jgi:hypothetical protein
MRDGATFAQILDAHLGCTDVPPPAARVWSSRPATAPLFSFNLPLTAARQNRGWSAPPMPAPAPAPPVPAATPIALTPLERRALNALNELGAALDDALTSASLRHAFRALARRYHPDANPGLSAAEHAQLARLFAVASEHYRLLAASLDARTH